MSAEIESLTIKRIHEPGRIPHQGKAVARNFVRIISQPLVVTIVILNRRGVLKHDPPDRMLQKMFLHPFGHGIARRRSENSLVPGQSGTHLTVIERNNPTPPAVAHEVIGGKATLGDHSRTGTFQLSLTLGRIKIAHVLKTGPHCRSWMGFRM